MHGKYGYRAGNTVNGAPACATGRLARFGLGGARRAVGEWALTSWALGNAAVDGLVSVRIRACPARDTTPASRRKYRPPGALLCCRARLSRHTPALVSPGSPHPLPVSCPPGAVCTPGRERLRWAKGGVGRPNSLGTAPQPRHRARGVTKMAYRHWHTCATCATPTTPRTRHFQSLQTRIIAG